MINPVEPWLSTHIDKGSRSEAEITEALEATSFGIVCLTRDNLSAPWILYEAGALSKTREAKVCTLLLGLTPADLEPPLSWFQHTLAEENEIRKLIHTINARVREHDEPALEERLLDEQFNDLWPKLEPELAQMEEDPKREPVRTDRQILEEILGVVRSIPPTPAEPMTATRQRSKRLKGRQFEVWVSPKRPDSK